jgi:hypothetical protein
MLNFTLIPYTPEWAERWDRFVMDGSQNGTFLQTRRFLGYHPIGRFEDASFLAALENGELLMAVPGARDAAQGETWFRSHPGGTFAGPVLSGHVTQAEDVLQLLDAADRYLTASGYRACELKITPQLFASQPTALLEYALFNRGYGQETELASYLPLYGRTAEELRGGYSATKRYELKRCEAKGLTARRLETDGELAAFYEVLSLNLRKFDSRPVHTLAELGDFLRERLKDEVRFLGVLDPAGRMVAGACLFHFRQTNVLHTQYLAADTRVRGYAPSAFLYDAVLKTGLESGAAALSFGTSTFEHGRVLNQGLIRNKEGYGCLPALNRRFVKRFG